MLSDRRNLNSMRVTAAFIEQVVANRQRYIGTPLMVDKLRLESGQYNRLTHLQDERTGAFCSQQIGSFIAFETLTEANGETVLVGTARVEKRFERACAAIQQLYDLDKLRVSFEITASVYQQLEDELIIDAAEGNNLIGMCIVSIPAYEDAKALALVASMTTDADTAYPSYMLPMQWTPAMEPIRVELVQPVQPANTEIVSDLSADETPVEKQPSQDAPTQETETPPEKIIERKDAMTEPEEVLTTSAEKPEEEEKEPIKEEKDKKPASKTAEAEDPQIAAMKAELDALKQTNAQLAQFKTKWEAAEAAALKAEEDKKREGIKQLLASHQLKAEDYQEAIEKLDYAAVVAAVNAAPIPEKPAAVVASANGLVQPDGIQMNGNKSDHPYHKLVKNLTM